jgi:uncharacterized membrane protein
MNWKVENRRIFLYLISAIVLLVGLGSAILIYQSAMDDSESSSAYEIVGGRLYPGSGYDKKYVHDLQLYGGQAAVLADRFMRWFDGLWHGESLAYTVAVITLLIALVFFVAAKKSRARLSSDGRNENSRDGTV